MKNHNLKKATAVALFSAATLSIAYPVFAQSAVSPEAAAKAKQICTEKAQADGFKVNSAETDANFSNNRVKVTLDLTKTADGTNSRLTCYMSEDQTASIGDDTAGVATDAPREGVNWLWWLVPIIGIPLLYFLFKGGSRPETAAAAYDTNRSRKYVDGTEGVIRANGDYLDIYSGPGTTYKVTGTLRNGQRIVLSGRSDNDWVELEGGGWIPRQYIEATYRQV